MSKSTHAVTQPPSGALEPLGRSWPKFWSYPCEGADLKNVLVIDPVTATVREEMWDGKLETLYKWIRTDIVAHARFNGVTIWVDQEGLMKALRTPKWFVPSLYPHPIVGPGVVVQTKLKKPSLEEVKKEVKWGLLINPKGPGAGADPH